MQLIIDGDVIDSFAVFKWFLTIILMINLQFRIDQEMFWAIRQQAINSLEVDTHL